MLHVGNLARAWLLLRGNKVGHSVLLPGLGPYPGPRLGRPSWPFLYFAPGSLSFMFT